MTTRQEKYGNVEIVPGLEDVGIALLVPLTGLAVGLVMVLVVLPVQYGVFLAPALVPMVVLHLLSFRAALGKIVASVLEVSVEMASMLEDLVAEAPVAKDLVVLMELEAEAILLQVLQ